MVAMGLGYPEFRGKPLGSVVSRGSAADRVQRAAFLLNSSSSSPGSGCLPANQIPRI